MTMTKRIVGGSHDINQLHPIKYKWAYEFHTAEINSHWVPEVVNMARDIQQWKTPGFLTEEERLMVKRNLGFFSTADAMAAANLIYNTARHVTALEATMFMITQAHTETVHIRAYDYIIQSLGIDATETYDAYRSIGSIRAKDNFLRPFVKPLNNGEKLSIRDLAETVYVFGALMEGLFFFVGFAQILALGRQNKLPGACTQYEYIMKDETRHAHFGMALFNQIIEENPSHFDAQFFNEIAKLTNEAVNLEYDYAVDSIRDGVLGIDAIRYSEYLKFIANRRLITCNLLPIYADVANPFPWLSISMDLPKNANFFETRPTEYSVGALDWE